MSDSINGYRAITRRAWRALALDAVGYTIEYQGTIRAMKLGLRGVPDLRRVAHRARRLAVAAAGLAVPAHLRPRGGSPLAERRGMSAPQRPLPNFPAEEALFWREHHDRLPSSMIVRGSAEDQARIAA